MDSISRISRTPPFSPCALVLVERKHDINHRTICGPVAARNRLVPLFPSCSGKIGGGCLPSFLSRKALIEERQNLGNVELYVFEIEVLLVIFLHLEQVVELEVQF